MSAGPAIALVDYGSGNVRSVAKALERSGCSVTLTDDGKAIHAADGVVLPGAGAFADCMQALHERGLVEVVRDGVAAGRPYLGLCLGLQLLFEESDEHGVTPGFGVFPGRVERLPETAPDGSRLCVPHIGWNEVRFEGQHPLVRRLPEKDAFYFVHSYHAIPKEQVHVAGRTEYGVEFVSAVARDTVFAVQFHPEKSQSAGHRLLDAFKGWVDETR